MPIKLPTPRDGWRVFVGEVGVIVLGVLIALGAQQAVEALRWREEVRRTEDALTIEIADTVLHAAEREMVYPCLRDRLNYLIGKVSANDGPWKGDPMPLGQAGLGIAVVPAAYRTPGRDWSDNVWEAAQSSGVLTHMQRQRVLAFSRLYATVESQRRVNEAEEQIFPNLLYLSFDTTLDGEGRRQALGMLGRLDWLNGMLVYDGRDLIEQAGAMNLDFSSTSLKRDLAEAEQNQRAFRGKCVQHVEVEL